MTKAKDKKVLLAEDNVNKLIYKREAKLTDKIVQDIFERGEFEGIDEITGMEKYRLDGRIVYIRTEKLNKIKEHLEEMDELHLTEEEIEDLEIAGLCIKKEEFLDKDFE